MHKPAAISRFWIFTAFVVLIQLAVVQAMVVSGSFHKCCHDHADEPGHECAVTLVLSGGYINVAPDVVPVTIVSEIPDVPVLAPNARNVEPAHLVGGVLAHAPPRGP